MNTKQKIAVALGLLISALFLWFAFRNLDPQTVIEEIRTANLPLLLLAAGWYFVAVSVITLRWDFLLRAIKPVGVRRLFPLVCIGYMGNNVYPFRSGEALRIYLLRRNEGVPIVKATTTVLVERVFDGLVMLTFIVVPLLFIDNTSEDIRNVATFAAPIFLTALALFFALAARPNLLRKLVEMVSRLLPGKIGELVSRLSEDVIDGLEGLRSPANLAGTVISSYVTWSLEASVYWLVAIAFDLNVSYAVMLVTVGTVNLAGLIPASPGQLGVFEFFVSAVLIGAGVLETRAVSYAIVVHLVIWLPVTLAGFAFLAQQGLGWNAVTHARDLQAEKQTDINTDALQSEEN
ncbi:MAG: lysylphosphatidylglycerol synthase transmembrane domain-containing protein [Aggregatilineales bacterium]